MQKMSAFKTRLNRAGSKLSWLLLAKVLAGLFISYLLISYFLVNPLAKKIVPWVAEDGLASIATVERVEFDPFSLKATVHGFKLDSKRGDALASFKKLVVDFELAGMFDLAWKFKQIGVLEPNVNLAIAPSGELNWDGLLDKLNKKQSEPSGTIPRLIIEHIMVSKGKVEYRDANRPTSINTTLAPLGFQLKGFSTLPKDRGDYFISAAFAENSGSLKWKGDMGVNPVASKGVVALEGVKVAHMLQLVEGLSLPIEVKKGDLQTSFNYNFSMPKTVPTVALSNIAVALNDFAGDLQQDGSLLLNNVSLNATVLEFVKNKQPSLLIKGVDLKLAGLNVKQGESLALMLEGVIANVPQLDFLMAETPQFTFQNLNVKFANIGVQKSKQLSLVVPAAEVGAVNFNLAESNLDIKEVTLSDLSLAKGVLVDAENKPFRHKPIATLNKIALRGGLVTLDDKKVSAEIVSLAGFNTSVIRKADKTLNWEALFSTQEAMVKPKKLAQSNKPEEGGSDSSNESSAWTLALEQVALDGANVHIQDDSVSTPVVMDVVKGSIEVKDVTLDMTKPLPIKAAFQVKQGGRFSTKGKLWPSPLKADLGLRLKALSLKPFAPYVNQVALLKLDSGEASLTGHLALKQQQKLALSFKGGFSVDEMALIEEEDGSPFLSWDRLSSKTLHASLAPNKLHLASLDLAKPSGKFIIFEDKTMNVKRILRSEAEAGGTPIPKNAGKEVVKEVTVNDGSLIQAAQPAQEREVAEVVLVPLEQAPASSASEAFPVAIDSVRFDDAKLEFADLSLTPQFGTNIHSLNGVINSLGTEAVKVAQVELDGKVDEYGSARIRGSLQPLNATDFTDVKLAFSNLDMSRLTPYSGKFAGRRIDSGKLSVDLEYKIKQHQLTGTNKFVINKIKLGEKVDSADAADLPLDLAIAILEDSDGLIDLDLPISGSLDDPKFSYGSIFWKAVRNVLTKIVTAPFRALGNIFGGGAEDFDGIAFESGLSDISPPELEKLVKVSTALSKRKGLSLGIVPSYNVKLDTAAIKESMYRQQVAEEMDVVLAEGQKHGPVDLANENVQDAVDALHNKLTGKGFFKRMVSKFEKPEEGHYNKAETALIASMEVTESDLKELAVARGEAIQSALLEHGVSQDRLNMMNPSSVKGDDVKTALTLDVKKAALTSPTEPEEVQGEAVQLTPA